MLLSLYASYLWANHSKKTYVSRMVVFVVLISLFSAALPLDGLIWFTFPLMFLSYPFYPHLFVEERELGEFIKIRFLTIDLTPLLPTTLEQIWHTCMVVFLIFLSVNVIGAVLGYRASRIRRIREWGTTKTWSLIGFILGITLIGVGFLFGSAFGREPYGFDGWALFYYGIIVLAIILWRHWDQLLERLP